MTIHEESQVEALVIQRTKKASIHVEYSLAVNVRQTFRVSERYRVTLTRRSRLNLCRALSRFTCLSSLIIFPALSMTTVMRLLMPSGWSVAPNSKLSERSVSTRSGKFRLYCSAKLFMSFQRPVH